MAAMMLMLKKFCITSFASIALIMMIMMMMIGASQSY